MLTIKAIGNAHSYRNYLSIEAIGEWVGKGSEKLGLKGEVGQEEYRNLRLGLNPSTGEKLRRNTPVDRLYHLRTRDGLEYTKTYHAAQVYDCVIGAPKTVSILGIEDTRAIDSHREAVAIVREEMERICGPIVIAQFHHNYSRAEDPHLHTHLLAMNLSWQGDKWQTLHASRLIRSQRDITESYRDSMLGRLENYGYRISRPEVHGISQELVDKFSQRSAIRDQLMNQFAKENGLKVLTGEQVNNLVHDNRPDKPKIGYEEFWNQQKERLTQAERISLKETVEIAQERAYKFNLRFEVGDGEDSGPELKPWTYGQRISM